MSLLDPEETHRWTKRFWAESVLPALMDCVRVPNLSPEFDPDWQKHGHMQRAAALVLDWYKAHPLPGMRCELLQLPGRTPLIAVELPGTAGPTTTLLYAHLDIQPAVAEQWDRDPWTPVLSGDKLYGRGASDDKYGPFAAFTALHILRSQGIAHGRALLLVEMSEESGSRDLLPYIEELRSRGTLQLPNLVVCLDSGCEDYERLWVTTSLRGLAGGILHVETLAHGIHSGDGSGIVPSCFGIARQLLDRIESSTSGHCTLPGLSPPIPPGRRDEARAAATVLGDRVWAGCPFLDGARALDSDPVELLLNKTWRPSLAITGAGGLPPMNDAGNVTLPGLALKLSVRLAPTTKAANASAEVKRALERDPPFGAHVVFEEEAGADGWQAPESPAWMEESVRAASLSYFGKEPAFAGVGGSIGFMSILQNLFPGAQFLTLGVDGPGSGAHSPNESLDVPMAVKLTCCVAEVIAALHSSCSSTPAGRLPGRNPLEPQSDPLGPPGT